MGKPGRGPERCFYPVAGQLGPAPAEDGSLLTFEVPERRLDGGRYYRGKVAAEVTRSKRSRTFYVAADAVGDIEAYTDSSRAWAVRGRSTKDCMSGCRAAGGHRGNQAAETVVRWRGLDGIVGSSR